MRTGARTIACVCVVGAVLTMGAPAMASDSEPSTSDAETTAAALVQQAASDAGAPTATAPSQVADTKAGASVSLPGTSLEYTIPGANLIGATDTATVLDTKGASLTTVQAVGDKGQRVAFIINNPDDPTRFALNLKSASSIVAQEDGTYAVLDENGEPMAAIAAPWAKDAAGRDVPTHYEIDGTRIVQVVEHKGGGFQYPITADPGFWRTIYVNIRTVWNSKPFLLLRCFGPMGWGLFLSTRGVPYQASMGTMNACSRL